jgi:hypothetical protein
LATGDGSRELDLSYPLLTNFVKSLSKSNKQRVNIIERRLSDGKLRPNVEELSPNKRIVKCNNLLEDRSILLDRSINIIPTEASITELGSSYLLQISYVEVGYKIYSRSINILGTANDRELGLFYPL